VLLLVCFCVLYNRCTCILTLSFCLGLLLIALAIETTLQLINSIYIIETGEGCGEKDHPGVYTEVAAVIDWIDETICKMSCYPPDTCDPSIVHPCSLAPPGTSGPTVALEGPVSLTVSIVLDTYPSEFAAIFTHVETSTELWYAGYGTWDDSDSPESEPLAVVETFSNLPAGIYHLVRTATIKTCLRDAHVISYLESF